MKSCTHYPVAAPLSLFARVNMHWPNHRSRQPFLLPLLLLLLAGAAQAQPFNQSSLVGPDNNPLKAPFDAGQRSVPVFVDIDNDCDQDCFVGNRDGNVLYYKNIGTASAPIFVEQLSSANPMNGFNVGSNAKPAFVDIDADGDYDCFVGAGNGTIYAFKNVGSVSAPNFDELAGPNPFFFEGNPFDGVSVVANASPGFIDIDNDGDFDCFVGRSASTNSIRYFRNESDQETPLFIEMTGAANPLSNDLSPLSIGANGNINSNACLTFLNIDGDSDLDCYVGMSDGTFKYFLNDGDGTFSVPISGPLDSGTPNPKDVGSANPEHSAPAFVDIDGDGDLDCFSGRNNGTFVYYRNDAVITARTIACKPTYIVNLSSSGSATVTPSLVPHTDLLLSSTFTCPNELTYTVTSSSSLSFTCTNATNTTVMPNGVPSSSFLTLRATDAANNSATCTVSITVLDKTGPVPTLTSLPNKTLDLCTVGTFPASYIPTATDVCSGTLTLSGTTSSTVSSAVGTYPVVWVFTDSRGNTTTQPQSFIVVSNAPPVFNNCPVIPPRPYNTAVCTYNPTAPGGSPLWTPPLPTDCDLPNPPIVVSSPNANPLGIFPLGTSAVSYAAEDIARNTGYCNFSVVITDNVPPAYTVTAPVSYTAPLTSVATVIPNGGTITQRNDQNLCSAVVTWTPPTISTSDVCGGAVAVSADRLPGSVFPVGTTVVTYKVTDARGNATNVLTFMVIVRDQQAPSITCPNNLTLPNELGKCTREVVISTPTATDNCSGVVVTSSGGPTGLTTVSVGSPITLSYTATDAAVPANTATCSYTITVVDNEKPNLTCPPNITVDDLNVLNPSGGTCGEVPPTWAVPVPTDNCGVSGSVIGTYIQPSVFAAGLTTVTYSAADINSNTATCTFTVLVRTTTPPVISNCPTAPVVRSNTPNRCDFRFVNSTVTPFTGAGEVIVQPVYPTCGDGKLTYRFASSNAIVPDGYDFPVGNTALTAVAVGADAQFSTPCAFTLQVKDTQGPTVSNCPASITKNNDAGACGAIAMWIEPDFTDNCLSNVIVISRTKTPPASPITPVASGDFFPIGTTTINYSAKDGTAPTANLGGLCSFTITVVDNEKPSITCPANVSRPTDLNVCTSAFVLPVPTVTDNCVSVSFPTSASASPAVAPLTIGSSATFALGVTTVTYTATDNSGNSSNTRTCTYTVTVKDEQAPTFTGCPVNRLFTITSGCSYTYNGWADPVASDLCSGPAVLGAPSSSNPLVVISGTSSNRIATFPTGITTISYAATDTKGNTRTCTFTVTIQEAVPPTITCPPNITVATSATACNRVLTPAILPVSASGTDACSAVTISNNLAVASVTVSAGSSSSVTWTARDASSNTATCVQTVSVTDQTAPVITCPTQPYTFVITNGNTCLENGNTGPASPGFTPPVPVATDNCASTLTAIRTPGQPGQYCTNTTNYLQWQVTDGTYTSTCSQQIIIQTPGCTPTTAQIAGCSAAPVTLQDTPGCPASLTVTPATFGLTATDNCNTPVAISPSTAVLNATGTAQNVTFTATVGQSVATCVRSVIVTPAVEICGNGIDDDCNPATSDVCPSNNTPTIVCPASVTVTTNVGSCLAFNVNLGTPTVTPAGLTPLNNAPTSYSPGTTSVIWGATNASGSTACLQTVTVIVNPANIEICGNGVDDDCDGLTDAADPDCGNSQQPCDPQKILAGTGTVNDGALNDYYGASVDVDGDLAVVGAYYDDDAGINSGSAYVLARDANNDWQRVAKIKPTDGSHSTADWFGRSVAIEGNYIVVGAPAENTKGAVYVFRKGATASSWTQIIPRLTDATGIASDNFGQSVDISSTHIIVGVPGDEPTATITNDHGCVFIFPINTTTGVIGAGAKSVALDAAIGDRYGSSVSIDGDNAVVGSPLDDTPGPRLNAGSAYVLHRVTANTWSEIVHRYASDPIANDNYGNSVSISGGTILVGSPLDDYGGKQNAGSVYALLQNEGGADNWGEIAKIFPNGLSNDQFGWSVALDGDAAVVGAHLSDVYGFNSGSAYLLSSAGDWSNPSLLEVSDEFGGVTDNFGYAVGISGTTVIVGSWKDDNLGVADQGSVTVFEGCSNLFRPAVADREKPGIAAPAKAGKVTCFPNPSTDIINIDVVLPQEEAVRVTVCDATGRVLETIFDDKADAESRFQWDGGRYGRGVYFIRVQSASVSKVVSVTLLR